MQKWRPKPALKMFIDRRPRVIIIGAGFYGLAAAKVTQSSSQLPYILLISAVQTLLEVEPSASLTIIDECTHVGGVWSYP